METVIDPIALRPAPNATEQVFAALYGAIVGLTLKPGAKVSEADVASRLDVSRQPVRDAFFRLSDLGFLQIRPQRGTFVTKIRPGAVLDAAFVRIALEVECCKLAASKASAADVAALRDLLAQQAAAADAPGPAPFHALDERFHKTLCQISGQPQAWDLILGQKAHMDRVRYLTLSKGRQRAVVAEHTRLVDAIAAGDKARAEAEIRAHLGTIRSDLPRVRASHPDYFDEAP